MRWTGVSCAVAALALLDCAPSTGDGLSEEAAAEAITEATCGTYLKCCEATPEVQAFADDCYEAFDDIGPELEQAREDGLIYQPDCVEALTEPNECLTGEEVASRPVPNLAALRCFIYTGTAELGESCTRNNFTTTCRTGLTCQDDVCVEPEPIELPELGESCQDAFVCGSTGSYCDFYGPEEAMCKELRAVGEPCERYQECRSLACEGGACVESDTPAICIHIEQSEQLAFPHPWSAR
jgi:hypothetical protein